MYSKRGQEKKKQETVHFSNFDSRGTRRTSCGQWPRTATRYCLPFSKKKKKKFVTVSKRSSCNCYNLTGKQEKSARAVNEQRTKPHTASLIRT